MDEWKAAVGEDYAKRVANRAAKRGTALHENVEKFLLNKEVNIIDPLKKYLFRAMVSALKRVDNIKLIEGSLYSDVLKLAGTVDCVAEFDNVLSVVDFKTSTRIKDKFEIESYFLQTAIYSMMVEELYGVKATQLVILMAVEDKSSPLIFIEPRNEWCAKALTLIKEYHAKRS